MSSVTEIEKAISNLSPEELEKLREWFAEFEKTQQSAYDLMKDGFGVVESEVDDLSNNPEHLGGFGR